MVQEQQEQKRRQMNQREAEKIATFATHYGTGAKEIMKEEQVGMEFPERIYDAWTLRQAKKAQIKKLEQEVIALTKHMDNAIPEPGMEVDGITCFIPKRSSVSYKDYVKYVIEEHVPPDEYRDAVQAKELLFTKKSVKHDFKEIKDENA